MTPNLLNKSENVAASYKKVASSFSSFSLQLRIRTQLLNREISYPFTLFKTWKISKILA